MKKFSSILFSYNEELRIEYVLRNLLPYSDVYVLDGGSTDKTQEITERLGAKFVVRPKIDTVHVETQEMLDFAKSLISTDWVFWSYVDNLLPKQLLETMSGIAEENTYKQVFVPIYTYMWGEVKHPVIKASYPNFFHKDFKDFTGNRMHGLGSFTGTKDQILHLPWKDGLGIKHYSLYDLNKFIAGHLRYGVTEAEDKLKHGRKFSTAYMLGSMTHYFWLFYKRGWKAGIIGLYIALLYSFFRLMVSVKMYEMEHNLTLEAIEQKFRADKQRLIDEIKELI